MFDFPLIDPHLHLWDLNQIDYPWLSQVPAINRSFGLRDYDAAREGIDVEAVVFVECDCAPGRYLDEVEWVRQLADTDSRLQGIVAHLPLENGAAIASEIEMIAGDPRVKGVRRLLFNQPDTLCEEPNFVRGVQLLGEAGLHFELTITVEQFPQVLKLMEAAPQTRFILDHIGNPDIAGGNLRPWRKQLEAFANAGPHPCKFSNLVCNANLEHWTVDDLKPYADVVLETFTPDRVIWAGDWPHVLRASSWKRWLDAAGTLTTHLDPKDRRKIFNHNAKEFYRLP